jgi:hypothetical protein
VALEKRQEQGVALQADTAQKIRIFLLLLGSTEESSYLGPVVSLQEKLSVV